MAYLDPKNDLTFKKVFGEHPDLLKSLLNALLPLEEGRLIESLEYLPIELTPVIPDFKNSLVDVRCYDNFGRQFIVEMQVVWTDYFKNRVLFNASKAYVKQLGKGAGFASLQPVYALSFINDSFQPDENKFYHHYAIIHTQDTNQRIDGLEFVFVELPHFKPTTYVQKKMAVLWLRFLTEIKDRTQNAPDELIDNEQIKKALDIVQESAFTPAELEYYEKYWDNISTQRTLFYDVPEKARRQGEKEGEIKGEIKGIRKQAILTALKMIEKGYDDTTISSFTELTITEIQTLRQSGTLD